MTLDGFILDLILAVSRAPMARDVEPLDVALGRLSPTARAAEFGVYQGTTLTRIARALPRGRVWGFDSFAGLPADWRPGFPAGKFGLAEPPMVPPPAQLVVGTFGDTLPRWVEENSQPLDLIHIDCDLYESTACVLSHLAPLITPATLVVFDELLNYPGFEAHEVRALWEHCLRANVIPQVVCSGGRDGQAACLLLKEPE